MDLKNWKKALVVGLASAAMCTSPSAFAAQANVTIDIDFPTILVMYHYNTITLDLDQTSLGTYLVGGTGPVACGADFCDDQGNPVTIVVPAITATTSVTSAIVDPGLASTTTEFTIVDPVGVRALGCSTYSVTIVDASTDAGITVDTANSLTAIDGTGCTFAMTTGDLVFDVDFTSVTADPASAIFDVTITGI